MTTTHLIGTTEAAKSLHLTTRYVRRLASRGILAGQKLGRDWQFEPQVIDAARTLRGFRPLADKPRA